MFYPIVYQNDSFFIVDKPQGLSVHSGSKVEKSLINELQKIYPTCQLVHRLDRDTAGLILIAKNKKKIPYCQKVLANAEKIYYAIVKGRIKKKIEYKKKIKIANKWLFSHSYFYSIQCFKNFTLLKVKIITGKNHQIRRQLAEMNVAILGDKKYGDYAWNRELNYKKLFLNSHQMIFHHQKKITLYSSLPNYFTDFLKKYNVKF